MTVIAEFGRRAKKNRQRARWAGENAPAPPAVRRRRAIEELEYIVERDRALPAQVQADREELKLAHGNLARLSRDLSATRASLEDVHRQASTAREKARRTERELRFLALAYTRTLTTLGIAHKIGPSIHQRVTPWIPDHEDPWQEEASS